MISKNGEWEKNTLQAISKPHNLGEVEALPSESEG